MYIRWIERGHKNAHASATKFHDVYVVESYRNPAGEPRRRVIAYLGNLRQIQGHLPPIERSLFWIRAEETLRQIPELADRDRQRLRRQLCQRVPNLTEEEMREGFQNTLCWYCQWWHEHGGAPSPEEVCALLAQVNTDMPA